MHCGPNQSLSQSMFQSVKQLNHSFNQSGSQSDSWSVTRGLDFCLLVSLCLILAYACKTVNGNGSLTINDKNTGWVEKAVKQTVS